MNQALHIENDLRANIPDYTQVRKQICRAYLKYSDSFWRTLQDMTNECLCKSINLSVKGLLVLWIARQGTWKRVILFPVSVFKVHCHNSVPLDLYQWYLADIWVASWVLTGHLSSFTFPSVPGKCLLCTFPSLGSLISYPCHDCSWNNNWLSQI